MSLRAVCGLGATLRRFSIPPNSRGFHVSAQQQQTQDLAGMFSEAFAAHPTPDKINALMKVIYTEAPHNNVTSFSLMCRSFTDYLDRWSIKGLRIGPNEGRRRSVVIVSGLQASERIPIGVNLFVAAALSRHPLPGVEVTVFPVMRPKEYEIEWRYKQAKEFLDAPVSSGIPIKLTTEYEGGVDGPLRNYVLKRSTNFVEIGMDLEPGNSTLSLKNNSLDRPLKRAEVFMRGLPSIGPDGEELPIPRFAVPGETTLFGTLVAPPAVVLELRDKNKTLAEDQISSYGEQVLTAIRKLLSDTEGPRGFVL